MCMTARTITPDLEPAAARDLMDLVTMDMNRRLALAALYEENRGAFYAITADAFRRLDEEAAQN